MRKSFNEILEILERRRRQLEEGQVPLIDAPELARQARGRPLGCPDEEALCGWMDGQLRGKSLWRWLSIWMHVRVRRCRHCQRKLKHLRAAMRPEEGQEMLDDHPRLVRQGQELTPLSSS